MMGVYKWSDRRTKQFWQAEIQTPQEKKSNEKEIKHEENTATESVMIISSNYQNYESLLFAKKDS